MKKFLTFIMTFILVCSAVFTCAYAVTADEVEDLLKNIDTLEQMQNKRSSYSASGHYDINTTNSTVINRHKTARERYETYVADMFAKRKEAQKAYSMLSDEEKAQIDPALSAKLSNNLENKWLTGEFSVTPRDDEFSYEAVKIGTGFSYEVGNYMVSGDIPQIFILVDTSDGADTWSPTEGEYVYGKSNYIAAYCCDKKTGLVHGTDYKRVNLEDSIYFDESQAENIRAILEISYPFVSVYGMKENLKARGLDAEFVDSLNRADMISAVQMAIWSNANINDEAAEGLSYFASIDVPRNRNIYFNPLHDYTNELWEWLPGKRVRTFDERAQYRVNTLAEFLGTLKPVEPTPDQVVISELEVVKTELISEKDGLYNITMYVAVNGGGNSKDDLKIHATSYSENEDGTVEVTQKTDCKAVLNDGVYAISTHAKDGDKIEVTVDGTQVISKGVYFYDPEGGRNSSQSLVGISEGKTEVSVSKNTLFVADLAHVPVQGIEIPETKLEIKEGQTIQLAVTVKPENATNKQLVFSSDNEDVATVDEKGNIVAKGTGTAVITVYSADKPSIKKEIIITVKAESADPIIPGIPDVLRKHYICFGKTDGIGWYEVSVNGGDFFPQGPNSTLEVDEGSVLVVRVQDMWIDDEFDFYVNGKKVPMDAANTITVVVDGYMLIGALSMDAEVPDVEESLTLFERIVKAFEDFFAWVASLFRIR